MATATAAAAPPVDLSLERRLTSAAALPPCPAAVIHRIRLTGTMAPYGWGIDGRGWADRRPLRVVRGDRVVIEMVNETPMAHPMHLHGHHFHVVALNGESVAGALRDTILVLPRGTVRVASRRRQPRPLAAALPQPLPHGDRDDHRAGL